MNALTPDEAEALIECFAHGAPLSGKTIVAMTGLDVAKLKAAGIVRTLGAWGSDDYLYPGPYFPPRHDEGGPDAEELRERSLLLKADRDNDNARQNND